MPLSVEFMQQDKFQLAANCIEIENEQVLSPSRTPNPSIISSQNCRKVSGQYWKKKFEKAQQIIS